MPLTKAEATQLKNSIARMQGPNLVNCGGVHVPIKEVLETIDLFTEEIIDEVNEGKRNYIFTEKDE